MICPYCKEKEGTKKNTHYLSDNIIRTALNVDGSTTREKGFYFDMSNDSGGIEFNFQRNTPQEKLVEGLGTEPSENQIKGAKIIPFSVDNVFCPACEEKFTVIENSFNEAILPKLRNTDLTNIHELSFGDVNIIRKYFYLQLWRSSICDHVFQLPEEVQDEMRDLLLSDDLQKQDLCKFPLSVTYLNTAGGPENYTQNVVGFTDDKNPFVVFMNDFVIQMFEDQESIEFFDFNELNSEDDYRKFLNVNEDEFFMKILSDDARIEFNLELLKESKGGPLLSMLKDNFRRMYFYLFKCEPSEAQIDNYMAFIVGGDQKMTVMYSIEDLADRTTKYVVGLFQKFLKE